MPGIFAALGVDLAVVDATTEALPDPRAFDGVVLGGSVGSANDQEPWRLALLGWLSGLGEKPFFGICGGHQLYARARGGSVGPTEPQVGVWPLELPGVPGFQGRVVQVHGEAVQAVPTGAEVWAQDGSGIQALRYGPTTWSTQFHPEFDERLALLAFDLVPHPEREPELVSAASASGKALLRAWLDEVRVRRTGPPDGGELSRSDTPRRPHR